MRRADLIGGLLLLVGGLAFTAVALARYTYWAPNGPGSGFLPFWLGIAMAVLAALLVVGAVRGSADTPWLPSGQGLRRLVAVLVVTALFIALLKVIGMIVGTALFLVTLLRGVERHRWATAIGVAVGVSALNYLVFTYWLQVPFPVSVLGF